MAIDDGAVDVKWADLPPELCGLVVDRLDALSVLSFPAVCKSWAAAYKGNPRPGAPTLLKSYDVDKAGTFTLHDVSSGKSFRAEAEGTKDRWWIGGKDDWMATTDIDNNIELLNPITSDRVCLPPFVTASSNEEPKFRYRLQQVIVCRTPAHRMGYLAVARFNYFLLAFTVAGDKYWRKFKDENYELKMYWDAIFYQGKTFAVSHFGAVYSWDMDRASRDYPEVVLPPSLPFSQAPRLHRFNLAPSSDGHLLLVSMYGYSTNGNRRRGTEPGSFHARGILLHKLDVGSSGAWQRISDLGGGDQALFVGTSYPFYVTVPRGSKDLKPNCVYVADMSGYEAVTFDLEQRESDAAVFQPLVYPSQGRRLQKPMWFRPTARLDDPTSAPKSD